MPFEADYQALLDLLADLEDVHDRAGDDPSTDSIALAGNIRLGPLNKLRALARLRPESNRD